MELTEQGVCSWDFANMFTKFSGSGLRNSHYAAAFQKLHVFYPACCCGVFPWASWMFAVLGLGGFLRRRFWIPQTCSFCNCWPDIR